VVVRSRSSKKRAGARKEGGEGTFAENRFPPTKGREGFDIAGSAKTQFSKREIDTPFSTIVGGEKKACGKGEKKEGAAVPEGEEFRQFPHANGEK